MLERKISDDLLEWKRSGTGKALLLTGARQIGKSYTLAGWAVDRLLKRPGRLVTVLSNSRATRSWESTRASEVNTGRRCRADRSRDKADGDAIG